MVTQLKAQFDDSLQLIHDTSSNFSFVETKSEYSKESSSEDLYNILVNKEKRITDLNAKVQKLETTVLDLQENLKEKDCIIDARTKAITLMTDSLSKKGKNTQDALDETKEQMKKMQEEFVKLENEMKARQIKLLDDLRLKNLEIAELQETNEKLKEDVVDAKSCKTVDFEEANELKEEIGDLSAKNSDLRVKIEELEDSNNKLREDYENQLKNLQESLEVTKIELEKSINTIETLETQNKGIPKQEEVKDQSDEITKLKKDLEDINKNMIKVKVEHKKKIKALNKKVESFKKIGDLNAHIVKLSEENDTLKEKIAELEEEKGNYQLKMMESFSKDSPSGEIIEELESKITELSASLDVQSERLKEIETENVSLKEHLELSKEKLQELSNLQNEKVTSEMSSIQFEELSESLEKEKHEILAVKERLQSENEELMDKMEVLNREKLEVQTKLEQYIHENMELIDKLEKLSAEKVSSAESIEIVDNLTHQEKLELEEYQKNLDPESGKLKISSDHLEGTPDLNDSVNQLTEETSELLQKIELFTVERREVMEKMESLTKENSQLKINLKQIENNRDLLTETYEQLQSEKKKLIIKSEHY
ncbi:hypothetical protein HHI36_010554 [Cryptolaemus montrouzieri]|uniref:Uncharacterized protein n=1 Tax=Cryptolaemus montrouzieri TaxID=559131 RepID=A0ABD2MJ34_9CUCU